MVQNVEEVQERLSEAADPVAERDEILRRAGVSIPTHRNPPPLQPPERLRPAWLAFLLRLVRYPD
ncbi:MAG TPA: hypothetical protein VGX50_05720 [Longimicrobium sp.]|jgi:hypothetical protein|nr:hypothetical protein [Longimicrobium sp.]